MRRSSFQFFGLPGSGKTYTINTLVNKYPNLYLKVPNLSKSKRYKLFLVFILKFPAISFYFFYLLIRNNFKLWAYLIHLVSKTFSDHMYVIYNRGSEKTYFIDEGVFQRILSVAPKSFSKDEALKILRILSVTDSDVVIVEGGDFGRFVSEPDRMISPRNKLGSLYFNKWAENLKSNFNTFSLILKENKNTFEIKGGELVKKVFNNPVIF